MPLRMVRTANPSPILMAVNPRKKKRRNMAATKRRGKRRASTSRAKRRTTRSTSHSIGLRVNPRRRRARRRNPIFARSRRRHTSRRRRNPGNIGSALTEGINLTVAGFGVTLAAPVVNRFVGGFLPLGQFTQPVIFALTGFGVSWLAGLTPFTRRFQRAAAVMGVALGATAILTPWVRKFFAGANLQGSIGMSGYRRNMRGIAAVTGVPPNILPPPSPAVQANQAMAGIASYPRTY